jgi:hypothetical protein
MFAPAYSGFPVELAGVDDLHAAFLNESRTPVGGALCRKSGYMGRKRVLQMLSLQAQRFLLLRRSFQLFLSRKLHLLEQI